MNLKKLLIASALALGLNAGALAATEGVDYEVLPKAMPQIQKDKVEVLEFFGYFCIHCKNLDPILLKHTKTFAKDTYFRTEHVVWDEGRDMNLARITAAVNQAGEKYAANPAIFGAIFDEKVNLSDAGVTAQWLNAQTSFNGKKVLEAYNSFSNQAQAKQMADYTREYQVQSTPTLIVGGKYKVIFNQGFENGMKTIDELVQKVREENGMKAPKPKAAAPKSKGASIAKAALK
ncbi:thiol:disulfide interchange protein DsbA/DsbL [Alysiella filiformis]|uniref:Thiol:disulfide interchange protein DsbA n=1 Tax=Alysiella filiformis DSM 16848 TaxID=1120981 RepID=A0A286EGZ5_9NEIS|nr:thiol:disulfide interchange protein DsbA/DsbL [Alysiella filiformis]QMT32354.1 thiol:disulfide interchange protein DsbA/DsbL [Alysiella filiformis]UBQ56726.1 thiol:disulfide interchange protein DsbA/DsbL [Alysiella filiformis DSM 16848]SOD70195.1 thiol:disulfide interchange protein DsbA [Alysiella filiformis DSM 16848]